MAYTAKLIEVDAMQDDEQDHADRRNPDGTGKSTTVDDTPAAGARPSSWRVTSWIAGQPHSPGRLDEERPPGSVLWIDFDSSSTALDECLEKLSTSCSGLDREMLEDLLTPDSLPGTTDYGGGRLRKVSTFSIDAISVSPAEERDDFEPPGRIVLQPVEMIAGDGWLICCWHPRSIYRGIHMEEEEPSVDREAVIRAVERRWTANPGTVGHTAADLGILVMEELALTYAPTIRKLHEWLEQWEIGLYVGRRTERRPLAQLWGSTALFRKWLAPLNPPGIQKDISKAWLLGATDHALCSSVDTRIDRALERGQELASTLRSSFNMLHGEIEEAARKRHERGQHHIEILAATLLVPTLIVGFFGANTWLPGRSGSVEAFDIMIAALVVLTVAVVGFLLMSRRADRAMDREAEAELADMRAFLGYRGP